MKKKYCCFLLAFFLVITSITPVKAMENLALSFEDEYVNDIDPVLNSEDSNPILENFSKTGIPYRIESDSEISTYSFDGMSPLEDTDEGSMIASGLLDGAGETHTYSLEIDHSLFPEVILMGFTYGIPGKFVLAVYDESGDKIARRPIESAPPLDMTYNARGYVTLKSEQGGNATYSIEVTSETEAAGYGLALGTNETFAEDFGNGAIITTLGKNIPNEQVAGFGMTSKLYSFQGLLNTGDWFHYTADGSETFITGQIANSRSLAFNVYDLADGSLVYQSNADDRIIEVEADGTVQCYVQRRLALKSGNDYIIVFYSTSPIPTENTTKPYTVGIGLPYISKESVSYKSAAYYVPANTTKTFSIKVSGYPASSRLCNMSSVQFTGGVASYNITQCTITAPNGERFIAKFGKYSYPSNPDVLDYLNNPSNVPLNGTWTVTVKSAVAATDFRLRIGSHVCQIKGNDGN